MIKSKKQAIFFLSKMITKCEDSNDIGNAELLKGLRSYIAKNVLADSDDHADERDSDILPE